MTETASSPIPWPALRDELSLHPGPAGRDGWPSWILRDPVRNQFFRIDWPGFEILSRWALGDPERIAQSIRADTTLDVDAEEAMEMAAMLERCHLLRADTPPAAARLLASARALKVSPWHWLLHHYLFFRVPLVRPDRALGATLGWVRWLGGGYFRLATLAALLTGLAMLARQWDRFAATLLDTFTVSGAATYGLALVAAKVVHELAHAYAAKQLGCRVPTMGVAFLVMWPVLYTDVNEAWLLPRRRDRLRVGAAGIVAELTLAAWATLAWGVLEDGLMRQAAFVLATTTWISSLLINLSPFMRFDGYFLLMDALNLPNLHPRSFALARWQLRETLFGLGEPPPETFSPAARRGLCLFAWTVWLYRLVLFLGIAVLVYHIFIKVVGIVLFLVELAWFVARPVWMELMEWRARRAVLLAGGRGRATLLLALAGLGAALTPWPTGVRAPAMLQAERHLSLYVPVAARLDSMTAVDGGEVAEGEDLFRFSAPDVTQRRDQAARRIAVLERELGSSGFDPLLQSRTQSLREELQAAVAERLNAERELERLTVTAPAAGRLADLMPGLRPGLWVGPKDQLAAVLGGGGAVVVAYVSEDAVDRLSEGAAARFVATAPGHSGLSAVVVGIERTALRTLDAAPLASVAGGPVAVRVADRQLVPEQALFRVRLSTGAGRPVSELPGTVHIDATPTSAVAALWRELVRLLVRESGL